MNPYLFAALIAGCFTVAGVLLTAVLRRPADRSTELLQAATTLKTYVEVLSAAVDKLTVEKAGIESHLMQQDNELRVIRRYLVSLFTFLRQHNIDDYPQAPPEVGV